MNLIKNIFYIITQWQSIFSDVPSHEVNDFSLKIIFFMEKILKGKGNTFESIKTSRNTVLLSNNNSTFPNKKYKNFKNFNSRPISLTPSEANTSNSKRNFFLFDWDEFEITRQLCLGTSHLLLKLNVNEILKYSFSSLIFNGNNNQFDSIKPLLKRYSNLKSLFIDEILSYSLPSQRAFFIEKLINISTYLSEMRNLNDLYCLLDVLSSPLIKNLSITWKYVNKKNLFKYSSLYKSFKNERLPRTASVAESSPINTGGLRGHRHISARRTIRVIQSTAAGEFIRSGKPSRRMRAQRRRRVRAFLLHRHGLSQ